MIHYPLHMMQGYELRLDEIQNFLEQIVLSKDSKDPAWQSVSKNRRALLPLGLWPCRKC